MKKVIFWVVLTALFVFCLTYFLDKLKSQFKVEIFYCDGRPNKTILVKQFQEPSNIDIDTEKRALSKYHNELNVCAIKVIK